MGRALPSPPDAGVFNGLRFATQTLRFLDGIQARFDEIAGIPLPGRPPLVIVTDPGLVRDALSRPTDFGRVPAMEAAALIAERGLVQSEGPLWRQQRALMAPGFAGDRANAYADTVGRLVVDMLERWQTGLESATPSTTPPTTTTDGAAPVLRRNLHRDLTTITLRAVTEVLLGHDIGQRQARAFHEWMRVAGDEFEFGIDTVTPPWLPAPISREFRTAATGIRELADDLIDRRRTTHPDDRPDMLGRLLSAADNPDVDLPPAQLRDEVATILIAGHETTALSLTYSHALLAAHPSVREAVRAEARTVIGDAHPTHAHAPDLEYTRRVFHEALRLYPPAWAVFRRTTTPVHLGGYRIPDGAAVVLPQWAIHRDPDYFEDPTTFDPDRWVDRAPGGVAGYFPFSTGPHACVGRQFSLTGAPVVLATIARDVDVTLPGSLLEHLQVSATLRPARAVTATIRQAR